MRSSTLVSLMAGMALFAGCENDCEEAANRVEDRYDECGFALPGEIDLDVDVDCSDNAASEYDCVADCAQDAPCSALDGSDTDEEEAYADCRDSCT